MAPEPRSRRYGTTAWVSHSAGPRLTSIMSRRSSGVAVSASPRWYVPMVFTSTSGGPTPAAVPPADPPAPPRAGAIAPPPPRPSRQFLQPPVAPVAPAHCDPGGRQLLRRRTAELTARAGHDRHTLAHTATSAETPAKTDDMAFLLPVMNGPGRSGRVQVHRREGERSSPDSGDLPAICDELSRPGARRRCAIVAGRIVGVVCSRDGGRQSRGRSDVARNVEL